MTDDTSLTAQLVAYTLVNLPYVVIICFVVRVLTEAGFWILVMHLVTDLFETRSSVAQSVERPAVNRQVVGSSPTRGAISKKKLAEKQKPVVESFSDEYKLPANPFE